MTTTATGSMRAMAAVENIDDLMYAVAEIRAHAPAYELAERYYRGTVKEIFCSDPIDRALSRSGGEFHLNLARRPVDAVLDRVEIEAVQAAEGTEMSAWLLDTIWRPNRLGRVSKVNHRAALMYGDGYMIAWPGVEEGTVGIYYNSPLTTRMFYDAENPSERRYMAKLWSHGSEANRVYRCNLYYPDRVEKYVTEAGRSGDQPSEWRHYLVPDEAWPLSNPYGVIPGYHFRTDTPYGRPRHRDAYGPQNAITKLSHSLMSTVDFQVFPQRWSLMHPDSAMPGGGVSWDGAADTADPDTLGGTGRQGRLRGGAGTLWDLVGDQVGQFDPADMDGFIGPMNFYARAIAASCATPLRFLEPSGSVPSGEALRADDAPITHAVGDFQDAMEEEYPPLLVLAASMAGRSIAPPDIQWKPAQTIDDEGGWKVVALKIAAGVPQRQALIEAGYSSQLVDEWLTSTNAQPTGTGGGDDQPSE